MTPKHKSEYGNKQSLSLPGSGEPTLAGVPLGPGCLRSLATPAMILRLLDRPIAYHRCLADIAGGVLPGLFLSQCIYWHNRLPNEREGWFWKTRDEWSRETGLDRYEQERSRKRLVSTGILEEKLRGTPPVVHFRINEKRLVELLSIGGNPPIEWREPAIREAGTRHSLKEAEITSESTSKTTEKNLQAPLSVDKQEKQIRQAQRELRENPESEGGKRAFDEAMGEIRRLAKQKVMP